MATKKKGPVKIVKTMKDGSTLFSDGRMRTGVVRISFVNFVTPRTQENDDGEERENYGCASLMPKGAPLDIYKLCCDRFAKSEKGESGMKKFKRRSWRLQDDKVDDYDGFVKGAYYYNTSSKYPPKATDRDKSEIELKSFYSGCYVRLLLQPYFYDVKGNRGIALGLAGVQFIRDGEPLSGGGVDPNDYMDEEEGEDIEDVEDDADGLI
jgi:hypothetical protein